MSKGAMDTAPGFFRVDRIESKACDSALPCGWRASFNNVISNSTALQCCYCSWRTDEEMKAW